MIIDNVQLEGLEEESYFFLNPIFVKIKSLDEKFITNARVRLTNKSAVSAKGGDLSTNIFELQSNPSGEVFFDISEYIKTISVYPNGYKGKNTDKDIPNSLNFIEISIIVFIKGSENNIIFNPVKSFILGGSEGNKTNIVASNLNLENQINYLTGSEVKIPAYFRSGDLIKNYSLDRFYMGNGEIISLKISEENISFRDHVLTEGCSDVLVRFLNSKGGYNYFVFDNYTTSVKTTSKGEVVRVNDFSKRDILNINKRVSSEREYTLITEVLKRHKLFIEDMISSQYLCVMFPNSDEFVEVELSGNSSPDTLDEVFDFSMSFKEINSKNN